MANEPIKDESVLNRYERILLVLEARPSLLNAAWITVLVLNRFKGQRCVAHRAELNKGFPAHRNTLAQIWDMRHKSKKRKRKKEKLWITVVTFILKKLGRNVIEIFKKVKKNMALLRKIFKNYTEGFNILVKIFFNEILVK